MLSAQSLQQLPDESQNRLEMVTNQLNHQGSFDDPQSDDDDYFDVPEDDQFDDTPAEVKEHLEQREAFRIYLTALPGVVSVRFYKRYGSWTGRAKFKDDAAAAQALDNFDTQRFPNVRIHICANDEKKLNFMASNSPKSKGRSSCRLLSHACSSGHDVYSRPKTPHENSCRFGAGR